jgi:hypothetical protein
LCCMLVKRDTSLKTGEMEKRTEIFLISDKCTCVLWKNQSNVSIHLRYIKAKAFLT